MPLPDPRLHLVLDPSDTPEHAQLLHTLASASPRHIVCEPRPGGRGTTAWLAETTLRALGKRGELAGHGRNAQLSWRRAIAWAASSDVDQIFVARAHLLAANDLEALVDLAALCSAEAWFIRPEGKIARGTREALASLPLQEWTYERFRRRWSPAGPQPTPASHGDPVAKPRYTELPDDEFPTFLVACKQLLDAAHSVHIEQDLCAAFAETDEWLTGRNDVTARDVAPFIFRLLQTHERRPEMLVAVRGAQVAFFQHRYLLKADIDRLLARRENHLGIERSADLADAICPYAGTSHAAAAACCLILDDPTLATTARLNINAVAADGAAIRVGTDTTAVPTELRPALRAHRLLRLMDGAAHSDPFFASEQKQQRGQPRLPVRTTPRGLQRLVRDFARETGLPLLVRYSVSKRSAERNWIYDLGLSVQKLRPVRTAARKAAA